VGDSPAEAYRSPRELRRVLAALPGVRAHVAVSVAAGVCGSAGAVVQAVALAHLLASAMPDAARTDRTGWFVLLACGFVARAAMALAGELVAGTGAGRAKTALRSRLVDAAVKSVPGLGTPGGSAAPGLSTSGGDPPSGPGELAALAARGLDALDVYLGRCLPDMVLAAVAPLALLVAVGVMDWLSALVLAVVVGLFPVFGALVGQASLRLAADRWARIEALGRHVADLFLGLATLRAFGQAPRQRERFRALNEALARSTTRALRVSFLSALVLDTLGSVSVALVAVPLGLRLLTGSVPLTAALAVLIVAPEVLLPMRRASAGFHESTEGLAAASRALAVTGLPERRRELGLLAPALAARAPVVPAPAGSVPAPQGTVPVAPVAGAVALRAASVVLPGRAAPVLKAADLVLQPGEHIVLAGPSGVGKTTLLALLLGFVRPTEGAVVVDGQDLADLELADWLSRVTYLPEHPVLLDGTLAENLRLAEPSASDAELMGALAEAGAADFATRWPDGLATPLGNGGRAVSAGERQRIAIARALLRRRPLYLLDEPTVHLDDATEGHVLASLGRVLSGQSAVIVSHRAAVQQLADRVLTIEGAHLVDAQPLVSAGAPA